MLAQLAIVSTLVCAPITTSEATSVAVMWGISSKLATEISHAALHEGLDRAILLRLVYVESRFDSAAISSAGAVGLMQVLPSTAGVPANDLLQPQVNLRIGTAYLRTLIVRYGNMRLALLAYNRGPTRVSYLLEAGYNPANGYARRVLQ